MSDEIKSGLRGITYHPGLTRDEIAVRLLEADVMHSGLSKRYRHVSGYSESVKLTIDAAVDHADNLLAKLGDKDG